MRIKLYNDFHNTQTSVNSNVLNIATVQRVRKSLCPSKGCTCSGDLGIRGPGNPELNETYLGTIELKLEKDLM